MKTIKVQTYSLFDEKRKWKRKILSKPLLKNLGKPKKVKKSDKKLSYKQARKKYSLKPFGDADRDGTYNKNDCRPFDPKKHGVYKRYKDSPVLFYDTKSYGVKPGEVTQGMIFSRLEEKLPNYFGAEKGDEGGPYSKKLTEALRGMEPGETVVKDIVGVHELEKPGSVSPETVFAMKHIGDFLQSSHPEKQFTFDIYNPSEVSYVDEKGMPQKSKLSRLLSLPAEGVSSSPRIPIHVQKKAKKVESIFPEIEKLAGRKLTPSEREQIQQRLVTQEDISGISSSVSMKPHWSLEEMTRHFGSTKDVTVHITDDPAEVVMKSMYSGMKSCEEIEDGMCRMGPFSDIENRNPVAYFYLTGRVPYKDSPSARVMMRRGHPVDTYGKLDTSKEYIGVEPTVYGGGHENVWYPYMLQELMKKKKLFHLPLKTKRPHKGYSDFVARNTSKALPYLRNEWIDMAHQKHEEGEISSEAVEEIEEGDDDDRLENILDIDWFHGIPSVYAGEIKKPSETVRALTYNESVETMLRRPPEKAIPRSFFYNILKSTHSSVVQAAMERPEMKQEYYHQLAFHPSSNVRTKVARFPKLEQHTIQHLMTQPDLDVSRGLFYNPALSFQQRKQVYRVAPQSYDTIGEETHPRTAKEIIKIVTKEGDHSLSYMARTTPNKTAIQYIYDNYPSKRMELMRNSTTPERLIRQYVSDVASGKENRDTKSDRIVTLMDIRSLEPATLLKIYNTFGSNPYIVDKLYFTDNTPVDIKRKIEKRLFSERYSYLKEKVLRKPWNLTTDTVIDFIDKLSAKDIATMLQSLSGSSFTDREDRTKIMKKLLDNINKGGADTPLLEETFMYLITSDRSEKMEKALLSLRKYPDELHRNVLRHLMKSSNKSTIDTLMRRYG